MSCDEDVGEVGEDEVEELVDRPGTTKATLLAVLQLIFLPFLMRSVSDHLSNVIIPVIFA